MLIFNTMIKSYRAWKCVIKHLRWFCRSLLVLHPSQQLICPKKSSSVHASFCFSWSQQWIWWYISHKVLISHTHQYAAAMCLSVQFFHQLSSWLSAILAHLLIRHDGSLEFLAVCVCMKGHLLDMFHFSKGTCYTGFVLYPAIPPSTKISRFV